MTTTSFALKPSDLKLDAVR